MKRNLLIITALAFALCIGGAFYIRNAKVASARRFIETIPGALKAERIEVPLFGSAIEIRNLTGEFAYFADAPYDVSIGTLLLEGVNPEAFDHSGPVRPSVKLPVKLVDRVYAKDYAFKAKGRSYPLLFSGIECAESDTQGIWIDVGAFKAVTSVDDDSFVTALLSMRFGPSTSGESRTAWVTPRGSRGPGTGGGLNVMTSGRTVAGAYTLAEFSNVEVHDVTVTEEGLYTLRMKEARLASGKNPRIVYSTMAAGGMQPEAALVLFPRMMQEGYALRGLEVIDLEVEINGVPGVIKTPRLSADLALGPTDVLCRIESASLTVPASMASLADPDLDFLARSMDVLDLRVLFDVKTARESDAKGTMEFTVELGELKLGDAMLHVTLGGRPMSGPGAYLPLDTSTIGLGGASLRLTDREFLRLLYPDAADRDAFADGLTELAREEELPPGSVEALERIGDFIKQSGSYEYDLTVSSMVSFMTLALNPDAFAQGLRMEARHVPPENTGTVPLWGPGHRE